MYVLESQPSWPARISGSMRTLVAIIITALLASALTVAWGDAMANGSGVVPSRGIQGTEIPVAVEGTIVGAADGLVALVERGAQSPVAFTVDENATLIRDGQTVALDELHSGDTARMTINGLTGDVLRLQATPATAPVIRIPGMAALLAAIGLIAGATALAIRNIDRLPVLPSRVAAPRLLPAAATR
jgi:predicted regulator of Ras-like GTPase activity (Roadblock/LC7/MglB family)